MHHQIFDYIFYNFRFSVNIDPLFSNTDFTKTGKESFILQKRSLLRNQFFLLSDYFAVTNNVKDIGSNTLPSDKKIFPGAYVK